MIKIINVYKVWKKERQLMMEITAEENKNRRRKEKKNIQ
jgi:hypothetical protein